MRSSFFYERRYVWSWKVLIFDWSHSATHTNEFNQSFVFVVCMWVRFLFLLRMFSGWDRVATDDIVFILIILVINYKVIKSKKPTTTFAWMYIHFIIDNMEIVCAYCLYSPNLLLSRFAYCVFVGSSHVRLRNWCEIANVMRREKGGT